MSLPRLGARRAGVVVCIGAAALLGLIGLVDALHTFEVRVDHFSKLGARQRAYGVSRTADRWPSLDVLDRAAAAMPENATYRIVFGPRWRHGRPRWTNDLTAQFLRYHFLPRREAPSHGEWLFCLGCDQNRLQGRFDVIAASPDGFRFGKLNR